MEGKLNDLISRQAFKEECIKAGFFPAQIAAVLKRIPAVDAVEVVRCEDCVLHNDCGFEQAQGGLKGFCSYGERKENV